jgi:hypothetical protein
MNPVLFAVVDDILLDEPRMSPESQLAHIQYRVGSKLLTQSD